VPADGHRGRSGSACIILRAGLPERSEELAQIEEADEEDADEEYAVEDEFEEDEEEEDDEMAAPWAGLGDKTKTPVRVWSHRLVWYRLHAKLCTIQHGYRPPSPPAQPPGADALLTLCRSKLPSSKSSAT
jgi:hypothetical protein